MQRYRLESEPRLRSWTMISAISRCRISRMSTSRPCGRARMPRSTAASAVMGQSGQPDASSRPIQRISQRPAAPGWMAAQRFKLILPNPQVTWRWIACGSGSLIVWEVEAAWPKVAEDVMKTGVRARDWHRSRRPTRSTGQLLDTNKPLRYQAGLRALVRPLRVTALVTDFNFARAVDCH